MPQLSIEVDRCSLVIEIGGVPLRVNTNDPVFLKMLEKRYAGFISASDDPEIEFDVDLRDSRHSDPEANLHVSQQSGRWVIVRGAFHAEWDSRLRRGRIRQSPNPYSIDAVFRIVHTLMLAKQGGFLLHAASAIRNGRAFVFAGVSGAGKTTIARLAPPDATLLTDEISYVRKHSGGYSAFGTPFTGELGKVGENVSAPLAAVYLLAKGSQNKIEPVGSGEAARGLLANLLFFAEDQQFVRMAFDSACEFARRVPVYRLTFVPDARVWEMIV